MHRNREIARLVLSGATATLIGIGLGRFAYAALLPAIIERDWFEPTAAAYLGAANLAGYLLGALLAARLGAALGTPRAIRVCMAVVILSFACLSLPATFAWFFLWRLLAGVAGAVLMVLAPSAVLSRLTPEQRKTAASFVFCGIGLGVLLSALLVPTLTAWSLSAAWWALALAGLLPAVLTWRQWGPARTDATGTEGAVEEPYAPRLIVAAVLAAYALDAIGFVPHTVFWVDFLAREGGYGVGTAGLFWALFGLGALAGPFLAGFGAKRLGWHTALALGLALKATAIGLPALWLTAATAVFSSLLVGALVPGIVALTSGRLAELVGTQRHARAWGLATAAFAAAQALAVYAMAAWYTRSDSYLPLFELGAVALAAASIIIVLSPWLQARFSHPKRPQAQEPSAWN